MSIGSRLTDLRNQRGLTRVQLADELNIPMTTLRNYEQDQREPGHKFLLEVSRYFGVTTDYILENEKSPAPEDAGDALTTDEVRKFLITYGFIDKTGSDISEGDVQFVSGMFNMLDAWFSRR